MKNTFLLTALSAFILVLAFMSFKKEGVTLAKQKQLIDDLVTENVDRFRADKEAECHERALQVAMTEADEYFITAKTATPKPRGTQAITKPASPKPTPSPAPTTTTTTTTYTPSVPTTTTTYTPPPPPAVYVPPTTTTTVPTTTTTTTTVPTTTITQPAKPSLGKGGAAPSKTTTTTTTTTTSGTTTLPKKPRLGKGKKRDN